MNVIENRRPAHSLALGPGTLLDGRYHVVRLLGGSSPFAITYLVRDDASGDDLVLKELLPRLHVGRPGPGREIRAHTLDDERTFQRMRHAFAREGEIVAALRHPGLPVIRASFDSHRTACWVAEPHPGATLGEFLAAAGGRVSAPTAVAIVTGVLDALEALHAEGVLHGHVAPDNIRVTPDLRPVLLGIGTTRHVVGGAKEPTAAYAPLEQYASSEVGPWTDVHACGALLYALLVGAPPPTAIERAAGRPLAIPQHVAATLPASLIRAITAALAPLPAERPHSVAELRRRIAEAGVGEARATADAAVAAPPAMPEDLAARLPEEREDAAPETPEEREDAASEPPQTIVVLPARERFRPDAGDDDGAAPGTWFDLSAAALDGAPAAEPWPIRLRQAFAAAVAKDAPARLLQRMRRHSTLAAVLVALLLLSSGAVASIAAIVRDVASGEPASEAGGGAPRTPEAPAQAASPLPPATAATGRDDALPLSIDSLAEGRVGIGLAGAVAARTATAPEEPDPAASGDSRFRVDAPTGPAVSVAIPLVGVAAPDLPLAVQTEIGRQIAQGALRVEFGDYVGALRIYRAVADRITALERAHAGSPALAAARRDVSRAHAGAQRACVAESAVRQARNESGLACG